VRDVLRQAARLHAGARELRAEHERALTRVVAAMSALRKPQARAELAGIPVARLKDVTGGRLRLGMLERMGYTTVLDVLDATPYELQRLPGIGPRTQRQVHAAAKQIERAAREVTAVQIDVERQDEETTALLAALHPLVAAGAELPRARRTADAVEERLAALMPVARGMSGWWRRLLSGEEKRRRAEEAVAGISEILAGQAETRLLITQATVDLLRPAPSGAEVWRSRPAAWMSGC
jgi:hypothetical protein